MWSPTSRRQHSRRALRYGSSLMRGSSGRFEPGLERRAVVHDGPEDVHAPACEGDDGLVVPLSLASLACVEGTAVIVREGAEGALVEHALEALVAATGPAQEASATGLPQDGRDTCCGGQGVGGTEAGETACLGDEFCGEHGPHARQAADEGRVRVAVEQCLQLTVEVDQFGSA